MVFTRIVSMVSLTFITAKGSCNTTCIHGDEYVDGKDTVLLGTRFGCYWEMKT